jgi:hypothetical protein
MCIDRCAGCGKALLLLLLLLLQDSASKLQLLIGSVLFCFIGQAIVGTSLYSVYIQQLHPYWWLEAAPSRVQLRSSCWLAVAGDGPAQRQQGGRADVPVVQQLCYTRSRTRDV